MQPTGKYIKLDGKQWYLIENYDQMKPFFISLASDTDLWMYLSSTGGLSCGRKSPDNALFPYYTDDKITENYLHTGPKTLIRVFRGEETLLWEPFNAEQDGRFEVCRSVMKAVVGNEIRFVEENRSLGLSFSYGWCPAGCYGWVRSSRLENTGREAVRVEIVDGVQNVLPAAVDRITQTTYSTLVDGYKRTEALTGQGDATIALFRMEAVMVDRAEPSEALRCNTGVLYGLPGADVLLSSEQLPAFRRGQALMPETDAKGVRCALLAHAVRTLLPEQADSWHIVLDVEKDAVSVRELMTLAAGGDMPRLVAEAIQAGTDHLTAIVRQNDGIQVTGDEANDARHFANVLFNTMRGGYYLDDYAIELKAFGHHIDIFNKALSAEVHEALEALPATMQRQELREALAALPLSEASYCDLMRLFEEYLPLTFSRRHGDPSRPWNLFSIRVQDEAGRPVIAYQGNWRDIFQNWEALSVSYPGFVNGIIAKFFNATTIDGYNPYKVTSEGIDWEVINPDDPWSNIGYWGDHQIIYLLKLLELSDQHDPRALEASLLEPIYAFANVPYRLKSYAEIVADPKNSIRFDDQLHRHILEQIPSFGQDARLVLEGGRVKMVTGVEKLLITLLTKLSNFVPEGGVWMNTLRPEWNDANNALVGNGASMVTLCYMRRYVRFVHNLLERMPEEQLELSSSVVRFMQEIHEAMEADSAMLQTGFSDEARRVFCDSVGEAGEHYRALSYDVADGKAVRTPELTDKSRVLSFLRLTKQYIDRSIRVNKREDGLYNAYNILHFEGDDKLRVQTMYPMLEGQVAVLTSGVLNAEEAAQLLTAMRDSALYREDQRSYMLYPNRHRERFLDKNNIPADAFTAEEQEALLKADVIRRDRDGILHFNPSFNNADFLRAHIERSFAASNNFEREASSDFTRAALTAYERVFRHAEFTGRSGTFYKYEGLGCIYWHMVSKLLLAVGETIQREATSNAEGIKRASALQTTSNAALLPLYAAIREGIGSHKSPAEYGSFPFDPYSHTPGMSGVQQPGMTGQVKEDILNRFMELGVEVRQGELHLSGDMLSEADYCQDGTLSFSYCSVPFTYALQGDKGVSVTFADGTEMQLADYTIPERVARHIFARDHAVSAIRVVF